VRALRRFSLALACGLSLAACGITAPTRGPGYAELDLPRAGLRRDTSISIGPRVLGFAARHANEGPETRAMLEAIEGIRIRVYRVEKDARLSWLTEQVSRGAARLQAGAWEPVMRAVDEESVVHMLIRRNAQDDLLGLALVSVDPEELVFINVMGNLNPDVLRAISDNSRLADSAPVPAAP